ncbi:MAG: hypothetical protein ACOZAG_00360 [Patescibacteria group bacterium]
MNIDRIFQSKIFQGVIIGIATLAVLLFVFKAGMTVGIKKADFSCRWSDNYHENFGGPRGGFWGGFNDKDFIESNGTVGQIIKIDGETLVVRGRGDVEKIIITNNETAIKRLRDTIKVSDLKIDENIITIGEPNETGQIEAKLIRVMPSPPMPFPGLPPRNF